MESHPEMDKPEFWKQINLASEVGLLQSEARCKGWLLPLVDPHDLLPPGVHSFVDAFRLRRHMRRRVKVAAMRLARVGIVGIDRRGE